MKFRNLFTTTFECDLNLNANGHVFDSNASISRFDHWFLVITIGSITEHLPHDRMDQQRLNILYHVFHGSVVAGDFALYDGTVVGNMAAESLIVMPDDACLKNRYFEV